MCRMKNMLDDLWVMVGSQDKEEMLQWAETRRRATNNDYYQMMARAEQEAREADERWEPDGVRQGVSGGTASDSHQESGPAEADPT